MAIDALPEAPSTNDVANFATEADAFLAALPTFRTQANALAAAMTAIAAGTALAIPLTFDSTTTDSDPGAGLLRLDNATQNAATTIRTDLVGADGSTWTSVFDTFDDSSSAIKGYIALKKLGDATKWLIFSVSAIASPAGYKNITVANVASSAASPFTNGDSLVMEFTRNGDKGDTGAAGANGSTAVTVQASRSSNTNLTTTDVDTYIPMTGTFTQGAVAVATIGANKVIRVGNEGDGVVTFDPNSTEQVNGASTLKIYPGETYELITTATGWKANGGAQKGAFVQISGPTAITAAATLDFANIFTSDFDLYKVIVKGAAPATDSVRLWFRVSTNGGSSYDAGASDYTGSVAQIDITGSNIGNAANETVSCEITVRNPTAVGFLSVHAEGMSVSPTTAASTFSSSAVRLTAQDTDSFRLLFSSGNFQAVGEVRVLAMKK